MTDHEILLKMKSILERMFSSEHTKDHEKINIAYELINEELAKPEPEVNRKTMVIIASLLQSIFRHHGLPDLPLMEPSND